MNSYSLSHLSDQDLLRDLADLLARERGATAALLPHIAEVDERKLYLPAGYPTMFDYCVHHLHLSEDAAAKRIHVARTARRFPALFAALTAGRLHLSGVSLLAPFLTAENAPELLEAAVHRSKRQTEVLLAQRFPRPDLPTRVRALGRAPQTAHPSGACSGVANAPGHVEAAAPRATVAPLSAERYALQVTIARDTHDKLGYAQALLGHAVPSGEIAAVLDRALDALIVQLEKQKFSATTRPRAQRSSADPRHVPAHVKRVVYERDGGQCGFVSETGQRCSARTRLEYDHVDPVACGGQSTVDGIRLRCRAHNQYEAECVFGAGFMATKREAAQQAAAEARAAKRAATEERARAAEAEQDPERSVVPWLRRLGVSLTEARELAARCEGMADAPMEERIRAALRHVARRTVSRGCAA